jgi:hypothetical protein
MPRRLALTKISSSDKEANDRLDFPLPGGVNLCLRLTFYMALSICVASAFGYARIMSLARIDNEGAAIPPKAATSLTNGVFFVVPSRSITVAV